MNDSLLARSLAALMLLSASRAAAATITWGTPSLINSDSNVSTTGTLLYAYTVGAAGVPPATVNGVIFSPLAVPDNTDAPVPVGSVTLAIDQGNFNTYFSSNTQAGFNSGSFSALSTAYKGLLQSGVSTNMGAGTDLLTLTLGGLTNGQSYQVQFWANDSGGISAGANGTVLTAGNVVTLDNNITNTTGEVGQWVTGSFTANALTQVVTLKSSFLGQDAPVLNAFQVRAVPEPGSAGLLVVAGVGLLLRRRRA